MRYNQYIKLLEIQLAQARWREKSNTDPFWGRARDWPIDTPENLFLGRAVDALGREKFGMAWQGTSHAGAVDTLPGRHRRDLATPSEVAKVCRILLALPEPPMILVSDEEFISLEQGREDENSELLAYEIASSRIDEQTWQKAVDIFEELYDAGPTMAHQWRIVQSDLHDAMLSGSLRTFVRPLNGGEAKPCAPSIWNTENWRERFTFCRLHPEDPFTKHAVDDVGMQHIFVGRDDFAKLMRASSLTSVALTNDYASPHLQIMLKVTRDMQLSRDAPPPRVENIVAALKRAWADSPYRGLPIGGSAFLKSLATALKEPGTQARRNSA